jgi:hypothetical protein
MFNKIAFLGGLTVFTTLVHGADTIGKPVKLPYKPVVETTADIARRGAFELPIRIREPKRTEKEVVRENLPQNRGSQEVSSWPVQTALATARRVDATTDTPDRNQSPFFSSSTSIGGPTLGDSGSVPPDSTGDVSPSSVVIAANGRIRAFSLNGTATLNVTDSTFFTSVSGGAGLSDPRVVFDRTSGRWFIAIITTNFVNSNNSVLLAVSNTEVINAATTWTFFQFAQNVGGGTNGFADYETLGVDANAVYIGWNKFNTTLNGFLGCDLVVLRKSALLANSLVVTPFRGVSPAAGAGIYTPQPCTNDDPAATQGIVIGVDNAAFGLLKCRRISNPGGTPVLSSEFGITVPATRFPIDMPISISATATGSVDSLDDRLFYARIFLNQTTGQRTLWTAHNVAVDATGASTASSNRTGSRWYEITNLFTTASPTLVQAGTIFDNAATNPRFCTIPSIAMNGQGHAFAGFSIGNTANSPGIGGAWRFAGAALGSNTAPSLLQAGVNFYNTSFESATGKRWGDYSVTTVDSRDGQSIWTFQEIVNAPNSWQVRAIKLLAPAPTITSISPNSITQGQSANIVITGTGIFDPGSSYPDRLAALISGTGLTVNSIVWNSPTQATVNVTAASNATTGNRTLTLRNPDQQTATSTLTVTQASYTISGTLSLNGWSSAASTSGLVFIYEIRDAGTNAVLQTQTITGLGAGNSFNFTTNLAPGNYRLRIKGQTRFLARSLPITITTSGATGLSFSLLNGDVNGDNTVGATDFNLVRAAWTATPSSTNWNANADLNGDLSVGATDFNIVRANWTLSGDN